MNSDWLSSSTPFDSYLHWADENPRMFSHPDWSEAIRSLRGEPIYCFNQKLGIGGLAARFRRSGLRIGFLGFPIAGLDWCGLPTATLEHLAGGLCSAIGLDLLRINLPLQELTVPRMTSGKPESWIQSISEWRSRDKKKLSKDISFAKRAKGQFEIAESLIDPEACYFLYERTVRTHHGKLRYSKPYFSKIASISESNLLLRAYSARDEKGTIHAFSVMAIDGGVGWYLHGGSDQAAKKKGTTDLLLNAMITDASSMGCDRFSLMATPWEQSGLSSFKRKWADTDGLAVTIDYPGSIIGHAVEAMTRFSNRRDRAAAISFASSRRPAS